MMKLTRIRKKPVEVEAIQHDGSRDSARAIQAWIEHGNPDGAVAALGGDGLWSVDFHTTDGNIATITAGVWVIRGVAGEFYPCQDAILRATYDILPDREALAGLAMLRVGDDCPQCDGDGWTLRTPALESRETCELCGGSGVYNP